MPQVAQATYSPAAISLAHSNFLGQIDGGGSVGKIRIFDSSDTLLSEVSLNDPGGTVDGGTGQLTFDIAGPDAAAAASGTADYVEFTDSLNSAYLSLPVQQGTSPVSGYCVLNSLSIVAGAPVTVVSATIG